MLKHTLFIRGYWCVWYGQCPIVVLEQMLKFKLPLRYSAILISNYNFNNLFQKHRHFLIRKYFKYTICFVSKNKKSHHIIHLNSTACCIFYITKHSHILKWGEVRWRVWLLAGMNQLCSLILYFCFLDATRSSSFFHNVFPPQRLVLQALKHPDQPAIYWNLWNLR